MCSEMKANVQSKSSFRFSVSCGLLRRGDELQADSSERLDRPIH